MNSSHFLERAAQRSAQWAGSSAAFALACAAVLAWLAAGPALGYSNTWQLTINTGTTIVTFLMVFLIQRAQNKDARAMQLKLNELIAAVEGASNRLIDIEDLDEAELDVLAKHYRALVAKIKEDESVSESHSIDQAHRRHAAKRDAVRATR